MLLLMSLTAKPYSQSSFSYLFVYFSLKQGTLYSHSFPGTHRDLTAISLVPLTFLKQTFFPNVLVCMKGVVVEVREQLSGVFSGSGEFRLVLTSNALTSCEGTLPSPVF